MENGGAPIRKVKLFQCGYCVNHLSHIVKHEKDRRLRFPAMVVFIRHERYGNLLFDTGYSKRVYQNGVISLIYNLLNPTYVKTEDTIRYRLMQEGIHRIDKVMLSHAHPDHIGGLKDFRGYELIATKEVWESMEHIRIRNLVFRNQVPRINRKVQKRVAKPAGNRHFLADYFSEIYDLLGDGSIWGVRLDGHCNGQMGIYIEAFHLFFAADSSWGNFFVKRAGQMRWIPRRLQADFNAYRETIQRIQRLRREHKEIQVIFSHEPFEERTYE
ncbi:MAG: MBL fold metallo-hydrolase [Clostridium sp.]|nr:MBL fold metallo-hydrolase [Clostridium sp.]